MIVVRANYMWYPFLDGNPTPMDRLVTSDTYKESRNEGIRRVCDTIENCEVCYGYHTGESGYQYAKILLSCVNDEELTKRYALSESNATMKLLRYESPEIYEEVSYCLCGKPKSSIAELGTALQNRIEQEIPMDVPEDIANAVSKDVEVLSKLLVIARVKGMVS